MALALTAAAPAAPAGARVPVAAPAVAAGPAVVAGPAATVVLGGQWWYEDMGVADAHALGATGQGVTVAVIDGSINPDLPAFEGADLQVRSEAFCRHDEPGQPVTSAMTPNSSHGSNVAAFVVGQSGPVRGVAPDATLLFYGVSAADGDAACDYYEPPGFKYGWAETFAAATRQAVDDGADIIVLSWSYNVGASTDVLRWAMNQGVIVVSAVNEYQGGDEWDDWMAADENGVVAVQAADRNIDPMEAVPGSGEPLDLDRVTVLAPGVDLALIGDLNAGTWDASEIASGTSFAAPIVAGVLAAVWSAHPDATSNQMLQSLIHDTGAQDHELGWDPDIGYGVVGLHHMLREDPTQYEDVNPLLVELRGSPEVLAAEITPESVANATRPVWSYEEDTLAATPTPTAAPAPVETSGPFPLVPVLIAVIGAGVLLSVVVIVLVVVLTRPRQPVGGPTP